MALKVPPLHVCRGLVREIVKASSKGSNRHEFVMKKYRANQVTSARLCRAHLEANHDAATYWCLLRSVREHDELITKYQGSGERDKEEVANLVGLKLPVEHAEGTMNKDLHDNDKEK